jgi:peptide/nickel transport system substrate-binding protein
MKKLICIMALIALLTATFTGCGNSAKDNTPANTPVTDGGSPAPDTSDDSETKSSIAVYVGTTIFDGSLDPVKGSMSYGYSFTNSALIKVNPDSEYVGDMAESWTISEDALKYTFWLRSGLMFSDGTALTAEDVVFTYKTVKDNQAENENVDLSRLAGVRAVDELTVEFTLSEPFSPFLDTTALLGIVPSASYEAEAFEHYPIGSGPWKVIQYDPNQQIIVEPNPYYYEGAAGIERITLVYMDNDAAIAAARSGQLDVVMVNPNYASESIAGMTAIPLETMDVRLISMPVLPVQENNGITFGNNVTSDVAVRHALTIGIDRAEIIQNAFNGIGKPAAGFTSNLIWADSIPVNDNRKDEAKTILEAAGWTDTDGDGIREKDGVACIFDVYAAEDRYVLVAALAEDAAELGIQIVPHSSDWGVITDNMYTSGVIWGWGQYSPTVLYSLFDAEVALTGGWDNVVSYMNPEVDAKIHDAIGAVTQTDAIENWKAAQELANADYPYLYIVNIEHCYFVSDRLDISADTQIPHPHGHGSPIICNMKDWTLK